jgi:hypothetical protein
LIVKVACRPPIVRSNRAFVPGSPSTASTRRHDSRIGRAA